MVVDVSFVVVKVGADVADVVKDDFSVDVVAIGSEDVVGFVVVIADDENMYAVCEEDVFNGVCLDVVKTGSEDVEGFVVDENDDETKSVVCEEDVFNVVCFEVGHVVQMILVEEDLVGTVDVNDIAFDDVECINVT